MQTSEQNQKVAILSGCRVKLLCHYLGETGGHPHTQAVHCRCTEGLDRASASRFSSTGVKIDVASWMQLCSLPYRLLKGAACIGDVIERVVVIKMLPVWEVCSHSKRLCSQCASSEA
eukprot:5840192-Amphidinium_carterae.2